MNNETPQSEVQTPTRVRFVTNFCSHYRVKIFETLARYYDITYLFFSAGEEWYWDQKHGVQSGNFKYEYLPGIQISNTRITPLLLWKLLWDPYDVVIKCINGRFALPISFIVSRIRRKPFILWTEIWMRLNSPMHRLFFPVTQFIYRHSDAIVVPGDHVRRYLLSEGVDENKIFGKITSIDNDAYNHPVPIEEQLELRKRFGIDADAKVVLYLGRLVEVKGLPYLLEAFAKVRDKNAVLVLAGQGNMEDDLRQMAETPGIAERVIFSGYVDVEDAIRYYATAWTLVLPSITLAVEKETWGLVINEAFNQGVPAIASDAVGAAAAGLVIDGETGFIVPERNADALAERLNEILDNEDLHARMKETTRSMIAQWDNEWMARGFRDAISYVTKK